MDRLLEEILDRHRCPLCFEPHEFCMVGVDSVMMCQLCMYLNNQLAEMTKATVPDLIDEIQKHFKEEYVQAKTDFLGRLQKNVRQLIKEEKATVVEDAEKSLSEVKAYFELRDAEKRVCELKSRRTNGR